MSSAAVSERRLVDIDPGHGRFRIHRDAYRNPEVFEREKELIFSKCWLYLGHDTEVRNKGDFVSRTIGGRDIIFMRARSGTVAAFFNSCTHRGTTVCREPRGNTKSLACPYHGWVFNTEGKLVSMNTDTGFAKEINADGSLDLRKVPASRGVPRVLFRQLQPRAISLGSTSRARRRFLDSMCDQSEAGLTVLPGEHSYSINANFKYLCENSYDGYHLLPVHVSYLEFLDDRLKASGCRQRGQFHLERVQEAGARARARQRSRGARVLGTDRTPGRELDSAVGSRGQEGDRRQAQLARRTAMARRSPISSRTCRRTS